MEKYVNKHDIDNQIIKLTNDQVNGKWQHFNTFTAQISIFISNKRLTQQ